MHSASKDPDLPEDAVSPLETAPVAASRKPMATWIFGPTGLAFLGVQALTGLLLMLCYRPESSVAWQDHFDLRQSPFFGLVHELHFWASQGIVLWVLLRLLRSVLRRAYRQVGFASWILGILFLFAILAAAWSGTHLAAASQTPWLLQIYVAHVALLPLILCGFLILLLRLTRDSPALEEETR